MYFEGGYCGVLGGVEDDDFVFCCELCYDCGV